MEEKERLVAVEERAKSNTKRLDEHDEEIKKLSNVYITLTKVTDKVDNVEKDISEMKTDIKDIKEKPAKNWDNLTKLIITRNRNSNSGFFISKIWIIEGGEKMTVQVLVYIVTTLFTYIAGKVSKKIGLNYSLPIPIQNILIGIIASIIGCLIHIEGLDANGVIQAVITALGGIGTATVLYDAKNK